jgi:hypothetical protein
LKRFFYDLLFAGFKKELYLEKEAVGRLEKLRSSPQF